MTRSFNLQVPWRGVTWSGLSHMRASPAKVVWSDQRMKPLLGSICLSHPPRKESMRGNWYVLQKVGSESEQRTFLTQKAAKILAVGKGGQWNFFLQGFLKQCITDSRQSDREWVRGSNCLMAEGWSRWPLKWFLRGISSGTSSPTH